MARSREITHLVACIVTVLAMGVAVAHADDPITNFFTGISIIAWAFGLIPTIIAFARGHSNLLALAFLNVVVCLIGIIPIVGWIVALLGWIGIFIWAASGPTRARERTSETPLGRGVRELFKWHSAEPMGPLDHANRQLSEELYPLPPETDEQKNKLGPADRGLEIEKLYRLKKGGSISEAEFERLIARL